jgi:hypothetical protein
MKSLNDQNSLTLSDKIIIWLESLADGDYLLDDFVNSRMVETFTAALEGVMPLLWVLGFEVILSEDGKKIRKTSPIQEEIKLAPKESVDFSVEVEELTEYFAKKGFSPESVILSGAETVTDEKKMVEAHLSILKSNSSTKSYGAYLLRLRTLRTQAERRGPGCKS